MSCRRLSNSDRVFDVDKALGRFRNKMIIACSRCARAGQGCFADVRSGRCEKCDKDRKKCDIRVTFKDFERLARSREMLSEQVDCAEDELEKAEAAVIASHEKVNTARKRAQLARRSLRTSEDREDKAYLRELASINMSTKIGHQTDPSLEEEERERTKHAVRLSTIGNPLAAAATTSLGTLVEDRECLGSLRNTPMVYDANSQDTFSWTDLERPRCGMAPETRREMRLETDCATELAITDQPLEFSFSGGTGDSQDLALDAALSVSLY